MGSVKSHYHDEICAREEDDCGLDQERGYEENEQQRLAEKAAGEPISQVEANEPPHAAEGTASRQSGEGSGHAFGFSADTAGTEGAGEALPDARHLLETLRFCAEFLERRADECRGRVGPVEFALRRAAGDMLLAALKETPNGN